MLAWPRSVRLEEAWKFRNLFVFPGRSFGRDNVTLYLTHRREEVKSYIAALAYTAICAGYIARA